MLIAMPYYFFPSTVPHAVRPLYRLPGSGPPCFIPLLPYRPFASVTAPVQRSSWRQRQVCPGSPGCAAPLLASPVLTTRRAAVLGGLGGGQHALMRERMETQGLWPEASTRADSQGFFSV